MPNPTLSPISSPTLRFGAGQLNIHPSYASKHPPDDTLPMVDRWKSLVPDECTITLVRGDGGTTLPDANARPGRRAKDGLVVQIEVDEPGADGQRHGFYRAWYRELEKRQSMEQLLGDNIQSAIGEMNTWNLLRTNPDAGLDVVLLQMKDAVDRMKEALAPKTRLGQWWQYYYDRKIAPRVVERPSKHRLGEPPDSSP